MKIRFLSLPTRIFAAAVVLFAVVSGIAQSNQPWSQNVSPLPPPTGFVNDYAGVLDAAAREQLEQKLRNLKETTDPQVEIAVAIVRTTGERDIFDYSLAVARGWRIGSKADDNPSALLFIAIDDRKYFTQISKDLEDELPDGLAGSLQRQYLVPEFRKGNYAKGISDTIDAYIGAIRNKGNVGGQPSSAPTETAGRTSSLPPPTTICCCLAVAMVFLFLLLPRFSRGPSARDRKRWGGGPFGGTGGRDSGVSDALPWIVGGMIAGSGSSSSSSSDWGSSWGGGSDWGGFGGGGDFGGGGAGGDW
jgi:uncharacterized protein